MLLAKFTTMFTTTKMNRPNQNNINEISLEILKKLTKRIETLEQRVLDLESQNKENIETLTNQDDTTDFYCSDYYAEQMRNAMG